MKEFEKVQAIKVTETLYMIEGECWGRGDWVDIADRYFDTREQAEEFLANQKALGFRRWWPKSKNTKITETVRTYLKEVEE